MPDSLRALVAVLLLPILLAAAPARADEALCGYRPPAPARLASLAAIADYRPVLRRCEAIDGRHRVATREMSIEGTKILLLADPQALTTRLEKADCWACVEASENDLAATPMMKEIAASAQAPGVAHRGFLENAGLVHGAASGAFITGDLCPSFRPLDRSFFATLEGTGAHAPVALSIAGLWLERHFADFRWLIDQRDAGKLDIVWVNHSFHHPFRRGLPDSETFLLTPGLDIDAEFLDSERLLIANGETPSLFFRFPGLVSTSALMQRARRFHLIALGADAWLAIGQRPRPGSIVLVHPNGNEPAGLAMFARDLSSGAIARPLEPLPALAR